MHTKIVEATNGINWGKFLLAKFDAEEWTRRSEVDDSGVPLLVQCGWGGAAPFVWILDLVTGEGACFRPGGNAGADLEKHSIWVCPLFPVFLTWFYRHPECWSLDALPALVTWTEEDDEAMAASALYGRRHGGRAAGGGLP